MIAVIEGQVTGQVVGRLLRIDEDGAADRTSTVEGALRATQYLHVGEVTQLLVDEVLTGHLYAVDEDADGRLASLHGRDAAQTDPKRPLPIAGVDTQVWDHRGEIGDAPDVGVLERLTGEKGYGD